MRLGDLLIMDEHSYKACRDSYYTICRPLIVSKNYDKIGGFCFLLSGDFVAMTIVHMR